MENYTFEVGSEAASTRLDQYLVSVLPKTVSRSHLKKLIGAGCILVNGKPAKPHHKVKSGEKIEVSFEEPASPELKAEDIALKIIYEDDDIIVINKQPGIAVHPAPGTRSGTIVNALLNHCRKLSDLNEGRPGIVHRLDKDTSGVMVAAKNNASHAELARQFKDRAVKKNYLALAKGVIELDNGVVDLPIGRHPSNRQKMAVRYDSERKAVTEYKVIKRFDDFTLVKLDLKTGRTHQIRVHMAYIGHPVLGDEKYGSKGNFPRQALHSYYLRLRHPKDGREMEFKADLPDDMRKMMGPDFFLAF
ncbi:MAG: RluA family pseudouridine synthase [Candidatus Omnitrophica bacterium]|nr:RluA family pseudouridine synthase [Candidatus Omnitrophota bacterium]MDD5310427.1 RluA family pseudouridine synthase [Candidatus Omnitrophota bacterium]MDD5546729.1 RluA family pseudouridine synthase [Candidatus Omnitrophota bacterium]